MAVDFRSFFHNQFKFVIKAGYKEHFPVKSQQGVHD